MEEALANVAVVLAMWLVYEGAVRLRARFLGSDDTSVTLYCPYREERIPIASELSEPEWSGADGEYGYSCEECGRVHVWNWHIAPAPIYTGDKIRIEFSK